MTEEQQIGRRLDAIRNSLLMTQTLFAQSLGVTQGFLNSVIHGKKGIGDTILINIAKVYKNVNLNWLITGEGEMHNFPNYYPPPELESGLPDRLEEGVRIKYAKPDGQLDAMRLQIEDHEQRLRDLEGRG